MSTARAIAAITNALRARIKDQLEVTALPLDKSEETGETNRLNVFLYQTAISGAWRNQDFPRVAGQGQPGRSILPLNLYYLVTAYGNGDGAAEDTLGKAMLKLHDNPIVEADKLLNTLRQIDPIRITPHPLSFDDMSKLWAAFQHPYRLSAAYEVGIVLIESEIGVPSPLPVRSLGEKNRGWDSTAQMPAFLERAEFETPQQPGVQPGQEFTLIGQNLQQKGTPSIQLRPTNVGVPTRPDLPTTISHETATAKLPDDWTAGVYTATVRHTVRSGVEEHVYASSAIPLAVLPRILIPEGGLTAKTANSVRSLTVDCLPPLLKQQRAQILIGSFEFDALPEGDSPLTLKASWSASSPPFRGKALLWARVRVDGVDSLIPIDKAGKLDTDYLVKGIPPPP